ncbi:hypothetical protein [Sphingobium nicotianae]|uniref:Uncharacterized protein n=1 Tax=Sphingobium nicotianae TaxID=2782607 RepID=A0A9X1DEE9_9SPHN|nr:hypothetical protein [Sphingobium nicotianae]MBT2188695.1 hypothetical protein [Sphingobium nicotianae]
MSRFSMRNPIGPLAYLLLAPPLLFAQQIATLFVFKAAGQGFDPDLLFWLIPLRAVLSPRLGG